MMIDPRATSSSCSPSVFSNSNRESDELLSSDDMDETDDFDSEISVETEFDLGGNNSEPENGKPSGGDKLGKSQQNPDNGIGPWISGSGGSHRLSVRIVG
jgi:hypothetical protein